MYPINITMAEQKRSKKQVDLPESVSDVAIRKNQNGSYSVVRRSRSTTGKKTYTQLSNVSLNAPVPEKVRNRFTTPAEARKAAVKAFGYAGRNYEEKDVQILASRQKKQSEATFEEEEEDGGDGNNGANGSDSA